MYTLKFGLKVPQITINRYSEHAEKRYLQSIMSGGEVIKLLIFPDLSLI